MKAREARSRRNLLVAVAVVMVFGAAIVSATVQSTNLFELGPGASTDEGGLTNIVGDGNAANGPDWADVFNADGTVANAFGATAATFIKDDVSAGSATDQTAFPKAGSDKNSDEVSAWNWQSASVPAKDDITNAYVFAKIDPVSGHLIIYAGAEREDPSGASHIDIEFFQKKVALSEAPPCDAGPCTFTGSNTDGDLLVSMDFATGGSFAGLTIRERDETAKDKYVDIDSLGGQGCDANDHVCAFSNGGSISGGPWDNFDNHGAVITNLQANAFTEWGVDVTAELGFTPCFSTVQVKTRSSGSFTAELKDFALAGFQQCTAGAKTEIHSGSSVGPTHTATDIQGTTVPPGTVHDKAIVTGTVAFPTPTGTVTFKRYTTANCTGTSTDETGVQLQQVTASSQTTAGVAAAESQTFTTSPGPLSYQAVYSGDTNYPGTVTSACEPLTIAKVNSAVTTDILKDNINGASVMNKAVDTNTVVVDKATVTGSATLGDPTGTVTFQLYATADCSGSHTDEAISISTADGDPTDGIRTAVSSTHTLGTAAGSLTSFKAIYSGDSRYNPSTSSLCEPICQFTFTTSQTPPP